MKQNGGEINESLDLTRPRLKCALMTHTRLLAAASTAALFVLAACQQEPVKVGEASDPQAEALKNAPKVELPPSIKEAKTYRCKDNSLVYVSFMSDNVTAMVRDKQEEPPVATLKAPAPGQPFVAEGFSLSGSGGTVTYKSPDSGTQSCRG
jgi:hypothetical protein